MCGSIYEEELVMSEVKWYDRGETGERLLELVESLLDGQISTSVFFREAMFLGLSEEEVGEILQKENV